MNDRQEIYDLLYTNKIDLVEEFRVIPIVVGMSKGFRFVPGEVIFDAEEIIGCSRFFGCWGEEFGWQVVREEDIIEVVYSPH